MTAGQRRRKQLVTAGLDLAISHGFDRVSRDMVAASVGCSPALLSRYWTAPEFQTALMEAAVLAECLAVVSQGLVTRHPVALAAPLGLRTSAAAALISPATDCNRGVTKCSHGTN